MDIHILLWSSAVALDLSVLKLFKYSFGKNFDYLALGLLTVLLHFASVPNVRACFTTNLILVALTGPKEEETYKATDTNKTITELYLRVQRCRMGETHTNKGTRRY